MIFENQRPKYKDLYLNMEFHKYFWHKEIPQIHMHGPLFIDIQIQNCF